MFSVCRWLLVFGVLFSTGTSYAANYVKNPGFESGKNYWLDLWGVPGFITAVPRSGLYSAGKQVGSVTTDYWSQLYQDIAVKAGQPVYARLYARSTLSPEATAEGGLLVQFLDVNNNVKGEMLGTRTVGGSMGWRLLEASTPATPLGTVKARLSGYLWAAKGDTASVSTGAVYFDDVQLDKIYKAPVVPSALVNTGFENGLNDWTDLHGSPAKLSKTVRYAGKYSASKAVDAVASQDYWSQLYQEVACTAGKKVTASLYASTVAQATALAKAGLVVEVLSSTGTKLAEYTSPTVGGQTSWRKLSAVIDSTPAGTARLRISGFLWAPKGNTASVGAVAYFDNASLSIAAPSLPPIVAGQSLVLYAETAPMNVTWGTDINLNQPPSSPNSITFTNQTAGEGQQSFKIKVNSNMFNVNFLRYPLVTYLDLSAYANGKLNFMVKATKGLSVSLHMAENYDIMVHLTNGLYGFKTDNTWCSVSIPMSDYVAKGVDLTRLYGWLKFYGGYYEGVEGGEEYFVDRVFFSK